MGLEHCQRGYHWAQILWCHLGECNITFCDRHLGVMYQIVSSFERDCLKLAFLWKKNMKWKMIFGGTYLRGNCFAVERASYHQCSNPTTIVQQHDQGASLIYCPPSPKSAPPLILPPPPTPVLDLMDLIGPIGGPAFSSQTPLVAFGGWTTAK